MCVCPFEDEHVCVCSAFNIKISLRSEWYLNGNYLVVFVSIGVILPLSLLKNLGKDSLKDAVFPLNRRLFTTCASDSAIDFKEVRSVSLSAV